VFVPSLRKFKKIRCAGSRAIAFAAAHEQPFKPSHYCGTFDLNVSPAAETNYILHVALLQVLRLPKNRTHTTKLQATEA
jgi:hypothetical protein